MVFSGIPFLYYFLPGVLLFYFLMPQSASGDTLQGRRNMVLLMWSLLFYAWGEPVYILLMLFEIAAGFFLGLLLEKSRERSILGGTPKQLLFLSILLFAGIFIYFKYTDFLLSIWNSVFDTHILLRHLTLPVGISFYTFQIISYLVDVYRGEVKAQRNLLSLATYIAMFPQLIAGPIVRYSLVEQELQSRRITWKDVEYGISRFILGLSKKVLLANEFGKLCDIFRQSNDKSVLFYWMYAVAFMLQIYFDFSGYSDMAIGLGRIFGFHFGENFAYPYISGSITEFWRRWHISLGTWFRDYVYIPLGGNRVGRKKWYRNIFIVWLLTGLWHGASFNFALWGLYFGGLLLLEKRGGKQILEKSRYLKHVYVLFLVMIGFVIFNAETLQQAGNDIAGMFGALPIPIVSLETRYYLKSYGVTYIAGMIGSTPLLCMAAEHWKARASIAYDIVKSILLCFLLLLSTAYLADGSFNPFLYFRF